MRKCSKHSCVNKHWHWYFSPLKRLSCKCGKGAPAPTIIPSPPPQPLATERFNEALLPFQVEQAKAFQPIILEQLIPLFKESGVPALQEQATQLAKTFLPLVNQIGQTASTRLTDVSRPDFESGFVGIGKELSDVMFQRAQERIAPQFQLARERVGERAAGRGTLRSGTTAKSLQDIDLAEIEARRVSAIDQAIFEYSEGQRLREVAETRRQTAVREAQTGAGFTPTAFSVPLPQFQSGGFINPTPPSVTFPAGGGGGVGSTLLGAGAVAGAAAPVIGAVGSAVGSAAASTVGIVTALAL